MDRNAAYPNYSNDLKCKRNNTEEIDHKLHRSDRNDNRNRFKPERICYTFVNTGQCMFGHRCKYRHINRFSSLEFNFRAKIVLISTFITPVGLDLCILLRMQTLIVNLPG